MGDKIPTAKICDPEKPGDFLLINSVDFDPAVHRLFAEPIPRLEEQPRTINQDAEAESTISALVSVGLDITVARLGPWLAEQRNREVLVRLHDVEKRKSAKRLILDRLKALEEG